jgi:hypothetical protein
LCAHIIKEFSNAKTPAFKDFEFIVTHLINNHEARISLKCPAADMILIERFQLSARYKAKPSNKSKQKFAAMVMEKSKGAFEPENCPLCSYSAPTFKSFSSQGLENHLTKAHCATILLDQDRIVLFAYPVQHQNGTELTKRKLKPKKKLTR